MAREKAKVYFDSKGPSGNIYNIINEVGKVMRKERRITAFNHMRDKVYASQSYAEALKVIREEVNLIDENGID